MNVRELITKLSQLDPDALVVMSNDAEGNAFMKMDEICDGYNFGNESCGRGDIGISELTQELELQGYTEEDFVEGVNCVVFWPV